MSTFVDEEDLVGAPKQQKKAGETQVGGNVLSRLLASALTGASKGAAGLADLATSADLNIRSRLGLPTFGLTPRDVALGPKVDVLREAIAQGTAFPVEREPTFPERAVQAATGSLMFPGTAVSNVGAALTSETVQDVLKQAGAGQGGQAVGGILAALPWTLKTPSNPMRTPQQQAERALRGYAPRQLREAALLQDEAAKAGLKISPAQALGDKGRVLDLEDFYLDSPFASGRVLEEAIDQPQKALRHAEKVAGTLGRADPSLGRANQVEAIIEGALELPTKAAGKAAAPYYSLFNQQRPQLSVAQRFDLANILGRTADDVGLLPGSEAERAASRMSNVAVQPSAILNPQTSKPFSLAAPDARSLDNFLKEISEQISGTYSPFASSAEKVQRAGLTPGASAIRSAVVESSPALRRGKEVYQQTLERLEPGVRATGLREAVARPAMEASAAKAPASWDKMEAVLKRGTEQDVTRALNVMKTEAGGGAAFADITKNMLNRVFDKHFSSESGKAGVSLSFAEELKKYPNIRKAVELSAAEAGHKDPNAVASGFMRALDIQQAAGRARGLPGGATIKEIEKYSAGKSGVSLLFGHGIARAATFVRNVQYALNRAEMEQLSSVFDNPRSVEALVALSKNKGPISASEYSLYKSLIGASQSEFPEQDIWQ